MSLPPELAPDVPAAVVGPDWKRTTTMEASIEVRVPTFTADDSSSFKIGQLEDWVLGTAAIAGALSRERLIAHEELAAAVDAWDKIDAGFGKSQADTRKAKTMLRPDLDGIIRQRRWIVERLTEEIDRFEREYVKVSRAYRMIEGPS